MQYDCATPLPYTFVLLPAVLRIKAGSLPGVNSLTLPPSTLPLSLNLFLFLQTPASLPMALPGPPSWLFPLPGTPFPPSVSRRLLLRLRCQLISPKSRLGCLFSRSLSDPKPSMSPSAQYSVLSASHHFPMSWPHPQTLLQWGLSVPARRCAAHSKKLVHVQMGE